MLENNVNVSFVEKLNPEAAAFVHGTCIETLRSTPLTKTLTKPAISHKSTHKDYFFMIPNKSSLNGTGFYNQVYFQAWEDIVKDAAMYAGFNAFLQYMHGILGELENFDYLELAPPHNDYTINDLLHQKNQKVAQYIGLTESRGVKFKDALEIWREASQRKGILLGLNHDIIQDFKIEKGKDEPGYEVCIYLPEALPIKYISEIVLLGDQNEKKEIESLLSRKTA